MTRSEVRSFLEQGTAVLSEVVKFNSGQVSDFNSEKDKPYPYVWLESLSMTETMEANKQETWNVVLHIAFKDSLDSKPEQYEALKDKADAIAAKLSDIYDRGLKKSRLITMPSRSRNTFHKRHADVLTGVILSFDLNTPSGSVFCVDLEPQC